MESVFSGGSKFLLHHVSIHMNISTYEFVNNTITEESRVMALSEIIINDIVQSQTNAVISESNYHILRQYLLERKPVSRVLNPINSLLSEHCNQDKQAIINHLTQLACESQRNHDLQEARSDEQEGINENSLMINYRSELLTLENTLKQLDTKCFQQQRQYNQVSRQFNELKVNMTHINQSIDRVRYERQLLDQQLNHPYSDGNVYTNPLTQTRIYPDLSPPQDRHTRDRLLQEENRLIEERQKLVHLINSKETEKNKEEQTLNRLHKEKKEAEERYSEVKHQIDVVLPNSEHQRQIRNQERLAREQARAIYDPHLLQLSHKNLEALKSQIETQIRELDERRNQLMGEATDISYKIYLTQLEQVLQELENGPQITFNENNALKMILAMMKNMEEMAEKEKDIASSIDKERHNLHSLQKSLVGYTRQLERYLTSDPHLVKQNKALTEENTQLQQYGESADNWRTKAFYASLFSVGGSLISIGILNTFIISPVFFAIPGALAALGVVSLVIAVVSYCQKYFSDMQMEQNNQKIEKNELILMKQWKKANELSLSIIPSLNAKIEQSEKELYALEQKLQDQQHAMSLLLNKAQNVTSNYGGSSNFFGNTTGNVFYLPSAPLHEDSPLYPEIEGERVNYGY
ncbi:Dot/Icm T4SS effector PieE [Legionella pneumophila serogroup 1]|uniref:Dot/Icm T4SS effector PieE n=1 Tax=Legionella pneumophila TaxID=446 RepID=UPI000931C86D|nr:Dot/Icm T4SS effector PieE [Legionella pneumophila]MCH9061721.1 Dot/Icm T4SS effector PieE [Legionella pneumophila serogroup 1]MCH9064685.1 Dot/Icm T4SS effector PieE [Legionella pneumophila serogroup 1]MCH9067803.1 Dot/Icm T4SS effector PieE [Legionella pneumophila serogroup 1]MCH9069882.1 Dot/Icm T4SS effector PieE [Legionella pneumophila serogroup 1]MCH9073772.1 Dot/Icm T4SS effector PieE [Legionella pneumophila serogroup 1]